MLMTQYLPIQRHQYILYMMQIVAFNIIAQKLTDKITSY